MTWYSDYKAPGPMTKSYNCVWDYTLRMICLSPSPCDTYHPFLPGPCHHCIVHIPVCSIASGFVPKLYKKTAISYGGFFWYFWYVIMAYILISTEGRLRSNRQWFIRACIYLYYHGKFASVTFFHETHPNVCPRFVASAAWAEKIVLGVYETFHFCAIPSITK